MTTFLPKENFSKTLLNEVSSIYKDSFIPSIIELDIRSKVGDHPLVPTTFIYKEDVNLKQIKSTEKIEHEITELSTSWKERLYRIINEKFENEKVQRLFLFYGEAFNESYQIEHSPEEASKDIYMLEKLSTDYPIDISIDDIELYREKSCYRIRIYKLGEPLILSDILPFIENVGFQIVSEKVSIISIENSVWSEIYDLTVTPKLIYKISSQEIKENLVRATRNLLSKKTTNDSLNYLLLSPGINEEEINIFRGIIRYLVQIKINTSEGLSDALINNPDITGLLLELFKTKFDPSSFKEFEESGLASEERKKSVEEIRENIMSSLRQVSKVSHDRSLRSILNIINSIIRTNYFNTNSKDRLSFKIDCSKVIGLPSPIPYREIFVSGLNFQGVHLRGGKVSRGGLRWSSRKDDFRTEVLGLMRTQMIKNAVIVPVGAKGGFVLHEEPTDRAELSEAIKNNYKNFIRGLLDITDNIVEKETKHPENCICYDGEDSYFVVAADRGTATFSNIANSIAEDEFKFWLGDAFASGGSSGYDHKVLGITARGAWESAKRHFKELGIDFQNQEFSVIGIGDMSGDVFGNGLILSDKAKLIAAFDHRHIFIDPNPDPVISFKERKRLFDLPSSSWDDYDKNLLSKGGAVYSRNEKEILLSNEAKTVLELKEDSYSPSELIKGILSSPADLLWNGGIGTYVKSSSETHGQASDRANDEVRVDGNQLKVRTIAEGGNLGLTQLSRIEYSTLGGRINTDAIDNSGGVDTSDLEVNLKLLFRQSLIDGSLTKEERNKILKSCESEVCEKVLYRNKSQSLLLSFGSKKSRAEIPKIKNLIKYLEKNGSLVSKSEFLPDAEGLDKRMSIKAGLTRPEFSILVAYLKMHIFDSILKSELPNDSYLQKFLASYFPASISDKFFNLLESHPLRKEIISTQLANLLVERMGITYLLNLMEDFSISMADCVKVFIISDALIGAKDIMSGLDKIDTPSNIKSFINSIFELQSGIDSISRALLRLNIKNNNISFYIDKYSLPFKKLVEETEEILNSIEEQKYQESIRNLLIQGLPKNLSKTLVSINYSTSYLDIINLSNDTNEDYVKIAKLSSILSNELRIGEILELIKLIGSENNWDSLAVNQLNYNIKNSINTITKSIIREFGILSEESINMYFSKKEIHLKRYKEVLSSSKKENPTVSIFYVLSEMLAQLAD